MFGLRNKADYEQLDQKFTALQIVQGKLKSEYEQERARNRALLQWIANVCDDVPLLKVRIDRCEAAYDRLTKLVAEAREKGWVEK